MYKKFALPVLLFAFVGSAQAEVITFGKDGSSFFQKSDPWEVFYVDTNNRNNPDIGPGAWAMVDEKGYEWLATDFREIKTTEFNSAVGLFDLEAMYLGGAWGDEYVTITGYANNAEVKSVSFQISKTPDQYIFNGFKGIDSFTITLNPNGFYKDEGNYWVLGNITVTQVPEPEAYAMLLAGLSLVGVMARRRQKV